MLLPAGEGEGWGQGGVRQRWRATGLPKAPHRSVVIRIDRRSPIVDEERSIEPRRDPVKGRGGLGESEAIGQVIRRRVRVPQGPQMKGRLDELQNAAEVMGDMR